LQHSKRIHVNITIKEISLGIINYYEYTHLHDWINALLKESSRCVKNLKSSQFLLKYKRVSREDQSAYVWLAPSIALCTEGAGWIARFQKNTNSASVESSCRLPLYNSSLKMGAMFRNILFSPTYIELQPRSRQPSKYRIFSVSSHAINDFKWLTFLQPLPFQCRSAGAGDIRRKDCKWRLYFKLLLAFPLIWQFILSLRRPRDLSVLDRLEDRISATMLSIKYVSLPDFLIISFIFCVMNLNNPRSHPSKYCFFLQYSLAIQTE
jgi:hypothetical protein